MPDTYFHNLSQSISDLVEKILSPELSFVSFIKRGRSIGLTDLDSLDGRFDVQVIPLLPYKIKDQPSELDFLKFNKSDDPDTVLVYRPPVTAIATFVVACPKADLTSKMSDLDKLNHFFFDHKSIEPFIPKSLESCPELYQRLKQSRAQIKPVSSSLNVDKIPGAIFFFEYSALYHSGRPLREEKRVQKRTIEWVNRAATNNLTNNL